jgi:multidrug efflux pump subunit AcrB
VGQFFAALSITLTIAVLVSLVLAVTIIRCWPRASSPARRERDDGGRAASRDDALAAHA